MNVSVTPETLISPFGADKIGRFAIAVGEFLTNLRKLLDQPAVQSFLLDLATQANTFAKNLEAFPSAGYAPYFANAGRCKLQAKLEAASIWYCAQLFYTEALEKKDALKAFHALARRRAWHVSIPKQADVLLLHATSAHLAENGFQAAARSGLWAELISILEDARLGDRSRWDRMREIMAQIVSLVPSARGKRPSFKTCLHMAFLFWCRKDGEPSGYTFRELSELDDGNGRKGGDTTGCFVDKATAVTRAELSDASFNPCAARQALVRDPRTEIVARRRGQP